MNPTRRAQQIEELFERSCTLPPAEREAYLAEACEGDDALRREIDSLLTCHDGSEEFLARPAIDHLGGAFDSRWSTRDLHVNGVPPGSRVGPYLLEEMIASGGMGTVYRGSRDDAEYHKQVAVKLVKYGLDNEEVLDRFRKERQALAYLDHPNIARLLDGGTIDAETAAKGSPYLVMEYIEGVSIDKYCDRERLTIAERLELFRTVCGAVAYAHRSLIVHRDLKPTNILVTAEGIPKLLDFGIAKLLDPELLDDAEPGTVETLRFLTPEYASPEQVRGEPIGTSTDIYSLGVILYELLTGVRPYRLTGRPPHDVEKLICDEEPIRPSSRVACETRDRIGTKERHSPEFATSHTRRSTPEKLRKRLVGDLDNIVMKALRKEPARRYASAGQLSEDIRRHVSGLPVTAQKDTFIYRWGKFVRRNRAWIAVGVLFVLLLISAVVFNMREARFAKKLAEEKQLEAETANRVIRSLLDIYEDFDPSKTEGIQVQAREVFDRVAERVASTLAEHPDKQAAAMELISDLYNDLSFDQSALDWLEKSLAVRRQIGSKEGPRLARSLHKLGLRYLEVHKPDTAQGLFEKALQLRKRHLGAKHPEVAETLHGLAGVHWLRSDLDTAAALFREALRIRRRSLTPPNSDLADNLHSLGHCVQDQGTREGYEEAPTYILEALEMMKELLGAHPNVARLLTAYGGALQDKGDYEDAEIPTRAGWKMQQSLRGPTDLITLTYKDSYGLLLKDLGRLDEALRVCGEVLEIRKHFENERPLAVAVSHLSLAKVHYDMGNLQATETDGRECLRRFREHLQADHLFFPKVQVLLGRTLIAKGELGEAETMLREALANLEDSMPHRSWKIARAKSALGASLIRPGRYAEAEPLLVESYPTIKDVRGSNHRRTLESLGWIVKLYRDWGKPEELAKYEAELKAATGND